MMKKVKSKIFPLPSHLVLHKYTMKKVKTKFFLSRTSRSIALTLVQDTRAEIAATLKLGKLHCK